MTKSRKLVAGDIPMSNSGEAQSIFWAYSKHLEPRNLFQCKVIAFSRDVSMCKPFRQSHVVLWSDISVGNVLAPLHSDRLNVRKFETLLGSLVSDQQVLAFLRDATRITDSSYGKGGPLFLRVHDETLSVVVMCVSDRNRSPARIHS
jgi:hypothetical protein